MTKKPKVSDQLTPADIEILRYITEFRILTVTQIAALTHRSRQVVRRRLRVFGAENLVTARSRALGAGPGARENVFSAAEATLAALGSNKKMPRHAVCVEGKAVEPLFIEHELLVNWFFIHLHHIQRAEPRFKVQYVIASSNCANPGKPTSISSVLRFAISESADESHVIVPDGVFTISDKEKCRALLLFVEVDRGTEPLVNTKRIPGDIRHKINCYQRLFQSGRYKGCESFFKASFRGFRLLFLLNDKGRMKAVCELVQSMPPSDFIWATTRDQMDQHGLSAPIWARGGRHEKTPESILGPLAFESSVLRTIR
jgi:hypothetical protein